MQGSPLSDSGSGQVQRRLAGHRWDHTGKRMTILRDDDFGRQSGSGPWLGEQRHRHASGWKPPFDSVECSPLRANLTFQASTVAYDSAPNAVAGHPPRERPDDPITRHHIQFEASSQGCGMFCTD